MSKRYPGGLITKTPVTPTTSSAPGVWTLEQALQYIKAGTWPLYVLTDPYFNYVTMLLHGDGTNGAQNNTFLDSSTNNFTITRNGNTTQGSFSPYGANWSNYFDGSSYEQLTDTTAIAFGSSDFTVEAFVFPTNVSGTQMIASKWSSASGPWQFFLSTNTAQFSITTGSGQFDVQSAAGTIVANTWTHIAVVRQTTSLKIYINGALSSTTSIGAVSVISRNDTVQIGARTFAGAPNFSGYVSNLRTVTSAVYTSNFTPSTTPLTAIANTSLLTCQSNRFVDNSTNAFAITVAGTPSVQRFSPFAPSAAYSTSVIGGSGYFDGGSDYLRLASGTTGVNGSAFTICLWFYPLNSSVIGLFDSDPNTVGCFRNYTTNTIEDQDNATKVNFANTYQVNAWNWMCITKSGTSFTVRINGTSIGTGNCATNMSENEFTVGAINGGGDGSYLGYISDFQILNTSTVVSPPTAPLTNASGKTLLLNFTNGGIFDNAMMNNLETVGNAQISTSVFKFGTGSMAFDGSGDWLTAPNSKGLYIGSGNFTIEGWLYLNALGSTKGIVSQFNSNGTGPGWTLYTKTTNVLEFYGGSGTVTVTGTTAISATTWTHFAVVRNGSTITIYINGTAGGTATNSSFSDDTAALVYIGGRADSAALSLNGYIDDLRITKGYARYTANFTPPAAAFPNN
jgi:hypothetical protein